METTNERKRTVKVANSLHKELKKKAAEQEKKLEEIVDEMLRKGLETAEK